MDRTALYKLGAAAESLKSSFYAVLSVRILQDLPKSSPSPGVEQQSSTRPCKVSRHAQWLGCVFYSERQRGQTWKEGRNKERDWKSLIRYSSSAFCCPLISSPCSGLLSVRSLRLEPELDVKMEITSLSRVLFKVIYFTVRAAVHCYHLPSVFFLPFLYGVFLGCSLSLKLLF